MTVSPEPEPLPKRHPQRRDDHDQQHYHYPHHHHDPHRRHRQQQKHAEPALVFVARGVTCGAVARGAESRTVALSRAVFDGVRMNAAPASALVALLWLVSIASVGSGCVDADRDAVPTRPSDTAADTTPRDEASARTIEPAPNPTGAGLPEAGSSGARGAATDTDPIPKEGELELSVDAGKPRILGALVVLEEVAGNGDEARSGLEVHVRYSCRLRDGTEVESSPSGEVVRIRLGTGSALPGLERGIIGLREGGRRRLEIPSSLAFGQRGLEERPGSRRYRVPPGAVLLVDVELVEVLP
jgi:hypothetical protein